ncbi:hypothetical protein GZ353_004043 [Salmonella enterica]|uniref:hypothetical protein n=1 Tax=Citrobacter cronae TaxID=1748967 RepID=UPI001D5C4C60|nr:hypothetical protein [Citrobacter cronae]EAX9402770.1 hypothetical protein [Salmonella enterica]EEG3323366.1 hypothetical protein [Salmonella enterica]
MALNYLDGKNLCDCDTDGHALLVARSGGQSTDLFITDDDHLRFLVIFANEHGRDLQSLFSRGGVNYQTCFCKITDGSFKVFLNSNKECDALRDFITSNDISEIEVSFPETTNYGDKELIKNSFINIIQEHVDTLDDVMWSGFVDRVFNGNSVCFEADHSLNEKIVNEYRQNILRLSRKELVKCNLEGRFEAWDYVQNLNQLSKRIGDIDGYPVWFEDSGYYFYWNKETGYLLESWLTFPAYPYGW